MTGGLHVGVWTCDRHWALSAQVVKMVRALTAGVDTSVILYSLPPKEEILSGVGSQAGLWECEICTWERDGLDVAWNVQDLYRRLAEEVE